MEITRFGPLASVSAEVVLLSPLRMMAPGIEPETGRREPRFFLPFGPQPSQFSSGGAS